MKNNNLGLDIKLNAGDTKKLLFNHSYWEKNADKFKNSHTVSWGDINIIKLEIKNILDYINKGDQVLDVGCSNGFSTFEIAKAKNIKMKAFDYSDKAIKIAKSQQSIKDPRHHVDFYHGNALSINEQDKSFDVAYTIRVVINLLTWEMQKKALLEIHRVLKPGGLYLMSEAFVGGLNNINKLRLLIGLNPLVMHDFNLYINERKLEKFIKPYFDIVAVKKFSSIYYVGSRVVRYLTMKKGEQDSFVNKFNNFFSQFPETENSGDFGVQKLYVLRKK